MSGSGDHRGWKVYVPCIFGLVLNFPNAYGAFFAYYSPALFDIPLSLRLIKRTLSDLVLRSWLV